MSTGIEREPLPSERAQLSEPVPQDEARQERLMRDMMQARPRYVGFDYTDAYISGTGWGFPNCVIPEVINFVDVL